MKCLTRTNATLFLLIVIGGILRLWNLGFQQMNADEEFTIGIAGLSTSIIPLIIKTLTYDFTPPFFYIAAHLSMLIFGESAFAIRFPSVIFGVLLIAAMYLIGKEYSDELFGLLLAGLSTIFYNFIYYSKYGRSYSLELLFFAVAFLFFMKAIKGDATAKILFAVFSLCCVWTHLFSAIPLAIMVLYLLWVDADRNWLLLLAIGCLPLFNYIGLLLERKVIQTSTFGATPFELATMIPLDILTYSSFIIFPIAVWVLWKNRSETITTIISIMCLFTWGMMFLLSFKTQIILHYALPLAIPLLMVFVLPFYTAIKNREFYFHHVVVIMVVLILEIVQINALFTIQRALG